MKAIIIFILLLISGQLIAQNTLSLQGCLEKAVSNNPTFKRGFLDAELAHTNTLAAKAQKLPQTQLQFAQGMNFGRSIDRFSNSYINQLYNSSYGNLQVAMPIYKGFQRQYLTESAQILEQAQEQNIASEKNKLTLLLLKAYLDVLAQQELVQAAEKQLENSKYQLSRQERFLEAGTAGKQEVIQFKNQVAADQGSLIDAETNLEMARLAIFQLMNSTPDNAIKFEKISDSEILHTSNTQNALTPENYLPQFKSFDLQSKSLEKQLRANKAENKPELNLYGNYSTFYTSTNPENGFFKQLNDTRNGSVSLNLSIPLFSRFATSPRSQQIRVQQKIVENTRAASKNMLNQEIETASLMLKALEKKYKNATLQMSLSQENLHMIERTIEAGTVNPIEFALAQTNLEKATANQIQTKYRWVLQNKILSFYQSGTFDLL